MVFIWAKGTLLCSIINHKAIKVKLTFSVQNNLNLAPLIPKIKNTKKVTQQWDKPVNYMIHIFKLRERTKLILNYFKECSFIIICLDNK